MTEGGDHGIFHDQKNECVVPFAEARDMVRSQLFRQAGRRTRAADAHHFSDGIASIEAVGLARAPAPAWDRLDVPDRDFPKQTL